MALDRPTLLARIDPLLRLVQSGEPGQIHAALQGTLTLVRMVYGLASAQEDTLNNALKKAQSATGAPNWTSPTFLAPAVLGTLMALRGDIEAGLVGDLRRKAVGEVIAEMLLLAKEGLADGSDGARNVAAVLAAAAFEDTIRRMGSTFAKVDDRRNLAEVLSALKDAKVLEGAPFTTAQSYLKFRNDALHADWAKLDAAVIGSCIAFVEHLLLRHFS